MQNRQSVRVFSAEPVPLEVVGIVLGYWGTQAPANACRTSRLEQGDFVHWVDY